MARKKKTPVDKTAKFRKWFQDAHDGSRKNRQEAAKDEKFYEGDQWSSNDREILKREKRPCLTFNEILPIVNLVSGFQRQNRADLVAYNIKGGSRRVAEIITKLVKHIMCYNYQE